MARAAKSPARARPKGYAAPTNGKATKTSSAARTSTKFLLVALVVLYATPSSLLLLSNPLLFFAIGAHNFMGVWREFRLGVVRCVCCLLSGDYVRDGVADPGAEEA